MGKSSGGLRASVSGGRVTGYATISDSRLAQYRGVANKAINEFGIKGEIKITISSRNVRGYAAQNISAYDSGGNPFRNEILVNPNTLNLAETIRHELRHIMQGQKGWYYQKKVGNERFHFWKGEKIVSRAEFTKINNGLERGNANSRAKYLRFPWEMDARAHQKIN